MPYKNRKKQLAAMRAWYRERYAEPEFKSSESARKARYRLDHPNTMKLPSTPKLASEIGNALERAWKRDRKKLIPPNRRDDPDAESAMRKVYWLGGFAGGKAIAQMYAKYRKQLGKLPAATTSSRQAD